jgi:hypothetical protein
MAPRTFDVKFPCGTQLTFGSLSFAAREDRELKMLPPGTTPEHLALASSATSGGSYSGSDSNAGSYIRTTKIVRGIPVVTSILRPLVGALSSSTSTSTPDPDSSDDYPEIGASACGEPCHIPKFSFRNVNHFSHKKFKISKKNSFYFKLN